VKRRMNRRGKVVFSPRVRSRARKFRRGSFTPTPVWSQLVISSSSLHLTRSPSRKTRSFLPPQEWSRRGEFPVLRLPQMPSHSGLRGAFFCECLSTPLHTVFFFTKRFHNPRPSSSSSGERSFTILLLLLLGLLLRRPGVRRRRPEGRVARFCP